MPSDSNVVYCALVALAYWTALGLPVVARLLPSTMAFAFAPLAGWAIHGVVAVPVFLVVPFDAVGIAATAASALAASWLVARSRGVKPEFGRTNGFDTGPAVRIAASAWVGAALLAAACAAAIVPKHVGDAVILSDQIFDHAKVAIVADIARLGMPPGNPFIGDGSGAGRLSYYYLLHFSAAELSRLLGVSGWEADIAMTFFSALTSLAAMMAVAVHYSGRASASLWVMALAASSSTRGLLLALFGRELDGWLAPPGGLGGWLFQSAWVPQHLASSTCVVLSVLLMKGLATRRDALAVVALASTVAAAFESSTWIGGVVFAVVALVVVPAIAMRVERSIRPGFVAALAAAAVLAALLAAPFLVDQFASVAERQGGSPIAVRPFRVLGHVFPESFRAAANLAAFWLVLLPLQLTAVYVPGMVVVFRALTRRSSADGLRELAMAASVALAASWLLSSTLAQNNDLGWRAALLGSVLLIVFAAIGLASWLAERRWTPAVLALGALALGLPEAALQVHRNVAGHFQPDGRRFATAPEMWRKVREHSRIDERIANNPLALKDMTPWPVNIGWSLLADRRSCYATWELTQVFSSVPHDRLEDIDARFVRVFAGNAVGGDIEALATVHDCSVVLVTDDDGAWLQDPFRSSAFYDLVDEDPARWRLYRRRVPKR